MSVRVYTHAYIHTCTYKVLSMLPPALDISHYYVLLSLKLTCVKLDCQMTEVLLSGFSTFFCTLVLAKISNSLAAFRKVSSKIELTSNKHERLVRSITLINLMWLAQRNRYAHSGGILASVVCFVDWSSGQLTVVGRVGGRKERKLQSMDKMLEVYHLKTRPKVRYS